MYTCACTCVEYMPVVIANSYHYRNVNRLLKKVYSGVNITDEEGECHGMRRGVSWDKEGSVMG